MDETKEFKDKLHKCLFEKEGKKQEVNCELFKIAGFEIINTETNEKIGDLFETFAEKEDIDWEKVKKKTLDFNEIKIMPEKEGVPLTRKYKVIKILGEHKEGEILNLPLNIDTFSLKRRGFIEEMK